MCSIRHAHLRARARREESASTRCNDQMEGTNLCNFRRLFATPLEIVSLVIILLGSTRALSLRVSACQWRALIFLMFDACVSRHPSLSLLLAAMLSNSWLSTSLNLASWFCPPLYINLPTFLSIALFSLSRSLLIYLYIIFVSINLSLSLSFSQFLSLSLYLSVYIYTHTYTYPAVLG